MTIRTTTSDALTTNLFTVPKARMSTVTMKASGLLPNSVYTFWVNGVNMSWACRTPGTRMGTPLTSDSAGSMTVLFASEVQADFSGGVGNSTKYYSMYLQDLNGSVKSLAVTSQFLNAK